MKSFDIEITETLQRTVSVIADSREEAEQMVDDGWHNVDYVLDSEDFIDVDFKTVGEGEKELSKSKKELDALLVKPNEYPQKVTIGAELKDLQEAVGGTITATYPFTDPVAIVCNDEGKLLGLPMNRALRDEHGQTYDVLTGNFLVVGLGKEDFAFGQEKAQFLCRAPVQTLQVGGRQNSKEHPYFLRCSSVALRHSRDSGRHHVR